MNISLEARQKQNDITVAEAEGINSNFDRITNDIQDIVDALNDYQIDLTSDVTGELPADNIDQDGLGLNALDFVATLTTRRVFGFQAFMSTAYAIGAPDAQFTHTSAAGATPDATTGWYVYTSGAGAGSGTGIESPSFCRIGHNPRIRFYIRTGSTITGVRYWFGYGNGAHTNVDTHAGHTASFRYSTVASDTGWMGVTRDGTTQSVTTLKVHDIAASTIYMLDISVSGSTVTFTVNDLTNGTDGTGTLSANLPTAAINLLVSGRAFTTAGGARTWELSRFQADAA